MQEPPGQFAVESLDIRVHLNEHASVAVPRPHSPILDDGNPQVFAEQCRQEITLLSHGTVDGIGDELPQRHRQVGPVDRAEVEAPAHVERLVARPAQFADHALDVLRH